ncbi:flagellar hook-basal body protein [Lacticigenium naphthae]|uniref:flagellar hook-basal body protein n=1 Tax=Lacticigenium naphthae TaxID=515351 RepID=UPI0004228695|nr:flagellar hook-basal body protein [Lacticigenium naphthae]
MNGIPFNISKNGLKAQQMKLNALANDIANVQTAGYKRKTVSFQDLLQNPLTEEDVRLRDPLQGGGIGAGVKATVTGTDFGQGALIGSQRQLDLAVAGEGVFGLIDDQGNRLYSKEGSFFVDANGSLVNGSGFRVETIPGNIAVTGNERLSVSAEGDLTAQVGEETIQLGRVALYRPQNPQALLPVGENLFASPEENGMVERADAIEGFGSIQQSFVETGNVDLAQAMTDMLVTQRAYSFNGKVLSSTDDIYGIINQFNQ